MSGPCVSAASLLEHVNNALATAHIEPMALGIDEQIISVAADLERSGDIAVLASKYHEFGGFTEGYEHPHCLVVKRHRKVRPCITNRPRSCLPSQGDVDHRNVSSVWYVHEDPAICAVELEALRMRFEWNVGDFGAARWIDDRERPVAVTDEDPVSLHVNANVVRVITKLDAATGREVGTFEEANRSVACIRYIEAVGRRHVADALRLL